MVEILELSDFRFKIPIINMVRALLEKVNIQDKMCNMGDENFKNEKKVLFIHFKNETNTATEMKNAFLQPRNSQ